MGGGNWEDRLPNYTLQINRTYYCATRVITNYHKTMFGQKTGWESLTISRLITERIYAE